MNFGKIKTKVIVSQDGLCYNSIKYGYIRKQKERFYYGNR